jgi:Tat protein secretion system quality control protein TatD with DNase activity
VPVYIHHTYIYIADLLGMSLDELQYICETNVRRLYDLGRFDK